MTQEQILQMLVTFNQEKGEYKSVNPILIENWMKQYITSNK